MKSPLFRFRPQLLVLLLGGFAPAACILSPIEDLPVDGGGSDLGGDADGSGDSSGSGGAGTGGAPGDVDDDTGGGGSAGAGGDEP